MWKVFTPQQRNTRSHSSPSVQYLAKEAEYYLAMDLAQSTKKTYRFSMRQFFTFCSHLLPVNEDALINFSVVMARSVQYTTIENYLSAVKNYHSSHGYELPQSNFLLLRISLAEFPDKCSYDSCLSQFTPPWLVRVLGRWSSG